MLADLQAYRTGMVIPTGQAAPPMHRHRHYQVKHLRLKLCCDCFAKQTAEISNKAFVAMVFELLNSTSQWLCVRPQANDASKAWQRCRTSITAFIRYGDVWPGCSSTPPAIGKRHQCEQVLRASPTEPIGIRFRRSTCSAAFWQQKVGRPVGNAFSQCQDCLGQLLQFSTFRASPAQRPQSKFIPSCQVAPRAELRPADIARELHTG